MTPDQLAKTKSEHAEQRALFAWANMASRFGFEVAWDDQSYTVPGYAAEAAHGIMSGSGYDPSRPELARMFAIPNGGKRDKITAAKLKAEGVKAGVPDIFLPVPQIIPARADWGGDPTVFNGLFIELKREASVGRAKGTTQGNQDDWAEYLTNADYRVALAYGWRQAAQLIEKYLTGG